MDEFNSSQLDSQFHRLEAMDDIRHKQCKACIRGDGKGPLEVNRDVSAPIVLLRRFLEMLVNGAIPEPLRRKP